MFDKYIIVIAAVCATAVAVILTAVAAILVARIILLPL